MVTVDIIRDRPEIERCIPLCRELARESGAHLPFQGLIHPLVWWDHFHNADGSDFHSRRGTNFLGSRSRLQELFLLVAHDGPDLTGALPLVRYSVDLPGGKDALSLITLPGDFFIAYKDFIVSPASGGETVRALLHAMSGFLDSHDLLILPHAPENSPNIGYIREGLRDLSMKGFQCTSAITGRRGGVRAWTVESIISSLRQIGGRMEGTGQGDEILKLASDLEACPPLHLMFPRTRGALENRIREALGAARRGGLPESSLEALETLLTDAPVLYPCISLPADAHAYLMAMSRETRRYFRRYGREYESRGGTFEKIASPDIRDEDVEDHLRLHSERWGDQSVSIRNEWSQRFHEDLCRRLASDGCFTLFFARYEGKRIATHSCIDMSGRREGYMTGRDPLYDRTRASRLLYLHTILDAIHHGFHTYDLGLGWHAYKMSFTKTCSRTLNFFISPAASAVDFTKLYLGYECMIPVDGTSDACLSGRALSSGV